MKNSELQRVQPGSILHVPEVRNASVPVTFEYDVAHFAVDFDGNAKLQSYRRTI